MAPLSVVTVVLAGGAGSRLGALTRDRAKPAVSYGAGYHLVDMPLSNSANSGFSDVWVVQQFHPVSLGAHLRNGRPWDLDKLDGGLLVLHPMQGDGEREGFHTGTADALWKQAEVLRDAAPDVTVVVSADAVYRLDYEALVRDHLASFAEVTMVTVRVDPDDASRYGVVEVDSNRNVTGYEYKPEDPATDLICAEIFAFTTSALVDRLEAIAEDIGAANGGDMGDIGDNLLPGIVADGHAREWRHDAYWRDVGTIESFWAGHMDLLGDDPVFRLEDPDWPLRTRSTFEGPARVGKRGSVSDCLLGFAARVDGSVERSVIAAGAVVEDGASVRDSVVLPGAVVRSGAQVATAIVDAGAEVPAGARIGQHQPSAGERDVRVALLGADPELAGKEDFVLPAGEVHPPEDDPGE